MITQQLSRRAAARSLAGGLLGAGAAFAAERPNFVFVLVDDLRFDALGCTGHPFMKTPNIDRLAAEGVNFRNAFVTTPLCSPARGSFLTGQYVHTHGVRDNTPAGNEISHRLVTFPLLLHKAGYETAYVGKWHMGNDDTARPGFDRWMSFGGQGLYENPPMNIEGKRVKQQGYMTDLLNRYAVEYVEGKHGKPFCLYLGHKAMHGPFTPAARHKDLYSTQPIVRPPNARGSLQGKPAMTRPMEDGKPAATGGGGSSDELIRNQLRCLQSIDEGVGEIYAALRKSGQLDRTVFVFTSDNGYFWREHGLGDKRWAYEESIRIPMVMRYPALARAGAKIDQSVLNIDIAPTFLDAAGVKVPAEIQGRSFLPLLRGRTAGWRESFLAEYFFEKNFPRTPTWHAVRTGEWKYIHYTELRGMDELYDMKNDPGEMNNRIGDASLKPTLAKLKAELARLLKESAG